MRLKDVDLMGRVLEASSDETWCDSFHPGEENRAGRVGGEATLLCQADADCSVEEVLQSHCSEDGTGGFYEDTGNQK